MKIKKVNNIVYGDFVVTKTDLIVGEHYGTLIWSDDKGFKTPQKVEVLVGSWYYRLKGGLYHYDMLERVKK